MKVENRSAMIRDLIASANTIKQKSAQHIVDNLASKGVSVSKQLVYQVRSAFRKDSRRKARISSSSSRRSTTLVKAKGLDTLIIAKNLLSSVGGDLKVAKSNLEIVAKLIFK